MNSSHTMQAFWCMHTHARVWMQVSGTWSAPVRKWLHLLAVGKVIRACW